MNVFLTASNARYKDVCLYNAYCARRYGKFDKVVVYDIDADIPTDYKNEHKDVFTTKAGAGLWLWKVYLIEKALREECQDGDVLFYADAASFFFRSVKPVIENMNGDIYACNLPYIEEEFTKREAFELMGLEGEEYSKTRQYHASFMAFCKSSQTIKFVQEWKNNCEYYKLISLEVEENQIPNFVGHRCDQSLFSLLCKKYGVKPSDDASQYGITGYGKWHEASFFPLPATSSFPICIMLHKQSKWNNLEKFKCWLRILKRQLIILYRKATNKQPLI